MSRFYGIGVGPGDEKLLTLKAVEVLKELDVLLIPATKSGKKGVAHTIAQKYLKDTLEIRHIDFPMVVDEQVFIDAGSKAAEIIKAEIGRGKTVGFITLGDPGVYSTYGYIVAALDCKVEIETIPGITSFCAAAAMANRPLVRKDEVLSIVPMNATDEQIDSVLADADAFAFMKVYKREKRLIALLEKHGLGENGILALRCGFDDACIEENVIEGLEANKDYLSIVHTRK
jgi:precorrin-2/cobalt-factor-2 C20-methyltransferase